MDKNRKVDTRTPKQQNQDNSLAGPSGATIGIGAVTTETNSEGQGFSVGERLNKAAFSRTGTRRKTPAPKSLDLQIPKSILDNICARFIVNLPAHVQTNATRLFFELELAHWYYVDFVAKNGAVHTFPNVKFNEFVKQVLIRTNLLPDCVDVDLEIDKWTAHKRKIPTAGAILLDESLEHVLLVKGYNTNIWNFPKGKVDGNESRSACARREVLEEAGYDIGGKIFEDLYIEKPVSAASSRLYIVTGVPVNHPFEPSARHEILKIQWFKVSDLPLRRIDGLNCNDTCLPAQFTQDLISKIAELKRKSAISQKIAELGGGIDNGAHRPSTNGNSPVTIFESGMHFLQSFSTRNPSDDTEMDVKKVESPLLDKPVYVAPPLSTSHGSDTPLWIRTELDKAARKRGRKVIKPSLRVGGNGKKVPPTYISTVGSVIADNIGQALPISSANVNLHTAPICMPEHFQNGAAMVELCEAWNNFKFNVGAEHFLSYDDINLTKPHSHR